MKSLIAVVLGALAVAGHARHREIVWQRRVVREAQASTVVRCILWRESTSTPTHLRAWSTNGSHWGIAQWDDPTWVAQHGTVFAKHPWLATGMQQLALLVHAIAAGDIGSWRPYDGC
jgi:hypothetical protein